MRIQRQQAIHVLDFPSLRQVFSYDCGASAVQTILTYYGIDMREAKIMKDLEADPKTGVDHRKIIDFLHKHGLKTDVRYELTVDMLKQIIRLGMPVILSLQAWRDDPSTDYASAVEDGHYVVAIGFTDTAMIFSDPSMVEDTFLTFKELDVRWHDIDTKTGETLEHFGIVVYGKAPVYHNDDILHMG